MNRGGRATDALGAMYFVAAVLMGVAAIVVIALMFLPSDLFRRAEAGYVPGTVEGYHGPAPSVQTEEQRRLDEELHAH